MWYTRKTHGAVKKDIFGDWSISDEALYLFLEDIIHLLTPDRLETVLLSDIGWKGKHDLNMLPLKGEVLRYKRVDPSIPGIIAFNAPNPYNDKYRMLDGKHRMHKLVSRNIKESQFYVLDFKDIRSYFVGESKKYYRKLEFVDSWGSP